MSGSREDIFLNSYYVGINLENILYGIELLLYFKTIRALLSNRAARKKSGVFYALFSSTMLLLVTVWVATQAIFGENMWVLHPNFPGGPHAYWKTKIGIWYMCWGTIAVIIMQLMTDALMIYRCRIIWNSNHVVVVPIILWLATLALGVLLAWVTDSPGSEFHTGVATEFSLVYWSVSVFLKTTLTCIICYRVVRYGRMVGDRLGHEYASLYFVITTIVIESVLPYTLSGITFLVALGVGSPTAAGFICVYFLMMCISSHMLILRMIAGNAWNNSTFRRPCSTIKFSPEDLSASSDSPVTV